ncbi:uncharacterized protein LOC106470916 isoform X2 [Limulus polyphemus]|uniref:Uncharacterized protein LOC106470916 isoform X2 n=1 Tax=Limulus polyphemus TaxID=6850 RepID=A0ABM1THA3_LIMPO|nr:uncharacterized protein LOC106470916 isoform X2 [Limulus polyphemus]
MVIGMELKAEYGGAGRYYQHLAKLQEKLCKKELQSLNLEHGVRNRARSAVIIRSYKRQFSPSNFNLERFLEERRDSEERNFKILQQVDKLEQQAMNIENRTQRLRSLKQEYKSFLQYYNSNYTSVQGAQNTREIPVSGVKAFDFSASQNHSTVNLDMDFSLEKESTNIVGPNPSNLYTFSSAGSGKLSTQQTLFLYEKGTSLVKTFRDASTQTDECWVCARCFRESSALKSSTSFEYAQRPICFNARIKQYQTPVLTNTNKLSYDCTCQTPCVKYIDPRYDLSSNLPDSVINDASIVHLNTSNHERSLMESHPTKYQLNGDTKDPLREGVFVTYSKNINNLTVVPRSTTSSALFVDIHQNQPSVLKYKESQEISLGTNFKIPTNETSGDEQNETAPFKHYENDSLVKISTLSSDLFLETNLRKLHEEMNNKIHENSHENVTDSSNKTLKLVESTQEACQEEIQMQQSHQLTSCNQQEKGVTPSARNGIWSKSSDKTISCQQLDIVSSLEIKECGLQIPLLPAENSVKKDVGVFPLMETTNSNILKDEKVEEQQIQLAAVGYQDEFTKNALMKKNDNAQNELLNDISANEGRTLNEFSLKISPDVVRSATEQLLEGDITKDTLDSISEGILLGDVSESVNNLPAFRESDNINSQEKEKLKKIETSDQGVDSKNELIILNNSYLKSADESTKVFETEKYGNQEKSVDKEVKKPVLNSSEQKGDKTKSVRLVDESTDDEDNFFDTGVPVTESTAYKSLLGNSTTQKTIQIVIENDSDSSDDIENVIAAAVAKNKNTFNNNANMKELSHLCQPKDKQGKMQDENIKGDDSTQPKERSRSISLQKTERVEKKLKSSLNKVLSIGVDSDSDVELPASKSAVNLNNEDCDEFDFYE